MKKFFSMLCLWALSCVAFSAMAQELNGNIYTIHCRIQGDNHPVGYMQDNKSDDNRITIGALNDASYWRFISSGNDNCYYIKNVSTGRYIQSYTTSEEMVTVGDARVEYYVKESSSWSGTYGMACTSLTPHDFTSGTLGLNLKGEADEDDCWAQAFAAQDGTNGRSFWILEGGTPYIGVAPGNYDEIYLYNVGTGKWFSNNDHNTSSWTSYSELNTRGRDLQMISENGGYRFNPKEGGSHQLRCDLWLDTSDTSNYDWTLTLVDGTTDQYTITGDDAWGGSTKYQLGANASGTITNTTNPTYGNWQLVTRESRIAYARDMATEDNPVDMSWIVLGATFPTGDEHYSVWGDWTYYKSKNTGCWYSIWGDGIINCNMVFEIGDNNNGNLYQEMNDMPNGSYVINADAIYSSATQDLINVDRYNAWVNGTEGNCGYIYANDKQVGVADIYDYVTTSQTTYNNLNLGNGYWTFNYTQSFSAYIFDGDAQTEDINLDITNHHLTVGAKVVNGPDECWLCVDNFRVYYYGGDEEEVEEGGTNEPAPQGTLNYPGSELAEGDYYFYNVGTGTWLDANDFHDGYWTTHAELTQVGIDFALIDLGDDTWQIDPKFGQNRFLRNNDLYLDPTDDLTPWTFTVADATNKTYNITSGEYKLGATADGYSTSIASDVVYGEWKLVSYADRLDFVKNNATEESPICMTWVIQNNTMANHDVDSRAAYWRTEGISNNAYWNNEWYNYGREYWNITTGKCYQDVYGLPNGTYKFNGKAIYTSTSGDDMSYAHYEAYLDGSEPTLGYIFVNDAATPMVNAYYFAKTYPITNYNENIGGGIYAPKPTAQKAAYIREGMGTSDVASVTVDDHHIQAGFKVEDAGETGWMVVHSINLWYCGGDDGTVDEMANIEDGDYYIYNVGTDTYLGDNYTNTDYYTTHAELGTRGRAFGISKDVTGGYIINPYMNGNNSLNAGNINPGNAEDGNLYMDTGFGLSRWKITAADNGYKFTCGNDFKLGATSEGLATTDPEAAAYDTWQFVTRSERMNNEHLKATGDEPVDMSWLIVDGTFPQNSELRSAWEGEWGGVDSYNFGGDGYYHCNVVWELWNISDRDVYQEITDLPNGYYTVRANGIYVSSDNNNTSYDHYQAYLDGSEPTLGYIYANDKSSQMINVYSLVTDEYIVDHNTKELAEDVWVYNGTNEFSTNFFEGKGYVNDMNVTISDGTLKVGAKVEGGTGSSWILIDNFTLIYYGSDASSLYAQLCAQIEALRTSLANVWAGVEADFGDEEIPEEFVAIKEKIEQEIADEQTKVDNLYLEDTLEANQADIEADITAIQAEIDALRSTATAIEEVSVEDNTATTIYTISGQKVNAPTSKGIYIINGKKVVVK